MTSLRDRILNAKDIPEYVVSTSNLGTLRITGFNGHTYAWLMKSLPELEALPAQQFLLCLLERIASRVHDTSSEPTDRPSRAELESLAPADLEQIADGFIQAHPWLFTDPSRPLPSHKGEDGRTVQIAGHEKVRIPRQSKETEVAYLQRVIVWRFKKSQEELSKAVRRFLGSTSHISLQTTEYVANLQESVLRLGATLRQALPGPVETLTHSIAPARPADLAPRVDDTPWQDVANESVSMLRNLTEAALSFASDFAEWRSRTNRHNNIALAIALATLLVTCVASLYSAHENRRTGDLLEEYLRLQASPRHIAHDAPPDAIPEHETGNLPADSIALPLLEVPPDTIPNRHPATGPSQPLDANNSSQ